MGLTQLLCCWCGCCRHLSVSYWWCHLQTLQWHQDLCPSSFGIQARSQPDLDPVSTFFAVGLTGLSKIWPDPTRSLTWPGSLLANGLLIRLRPDSILHLTWLTQIRVVFFVNRLQRGCFFPTPKRLCRTTCSSKLADDISTVSQWQRRHRGNRRRRHYLNRRSAATKQQWE